MPYAGNKSMGKAKSARKRPTLSAKASPKARAAVAKSKASMRKGYGRKR